MVHLTRVTFSVLRTILHDTKIKLFLEKKNAFNYFIFCCVNFTVFFHGDVSHAQHCSTLLNSELGIFTF